MRRISSPIERCGLATRRDYQ